MDEANLKRLRERYGNALGGEMFDPKFKAVAESQFSTGDRRKWPFADVATLLGARYRPEAPDLPDFGGLDFALIGVPMDLGVTNRAGSRFGPRAVRAVERVGPYEHVLRARAADDGEIRRRRRRADALALFAGELPSRHRAVHEPASSTPASFR